MSSSLSYSLESSIAPILEANSKNLLAFLLRPQNLYPVYRRLLDTLGPAEIITLSKSCKALSGLYKSILASDWDINKALDRFTDDPKRFRSMLNETSAVISGSFALDFFDRNVTEASQLEIVMGVYSWDRTKPKDYIEWDKALDAPDRTLTRRNNCETIFRYLVDVEGYSLVPDDEIVDDAIFHRGIKEGSQDWLVETMRQSSSGACIKLNSAYVAAPGDDWACTCLADLITEFATTAGANFILADKAISLFPSLTFTRRVAYSTSEAVFMDLDYGKCPQPLLRRGIWPEQFFFPILAPDIIHQEHDTLSREVFYEESRRISGPHSWGLPLDMEGVSASAVPDGVIEAANFALRIESSSIEEMRRDKTPSGQVIRISSSAFTCPSLKYTYCLELAMIAQNFRQEMFVQKAETAWHSHYNKTISASNAMSIETRDLNFVANTRRDLLREASRLSHEWFKDDEVPQWINDCKGLEETFVVWPQEPTKRIKVPGITD